MKISDLFGPMGNREVKSFLGCSSYFDKVKEGMRWSLFIAWPAKSWSLGLKGMTCVNMHNALALYVLNFHWLHVWVEIYYNISCIMLN